MAARSAEVERRGPTFCADVSARRSVRRAQERPRRLRGSGLHFPLFLFLCEENYLRDNVQCRLSRCFSQVVGLQHRALELCVKKGSESFMKGQQEIQDEFDSEIFFSVQFCLLLSVSTMWIRIRHFSPIWLAEMAQMDDEEWSETQDTCVEEKENKMVSNA